MGALETLLSVQEHDTALAQLCHRRSHLPEQQTLDACEARLVRLEAGLSTVRAEEARLSAGQDDLEHSIADVEAKITAAERQLYGGTVSASRELQALEADIASLKKHRGSLEDAELEVLMEREPVDARLRAADVERDAIDAEAMGLRVAVAEASLAIDASIDEHADARAGLEAEIGPDLLTVYEQSRVKNRGIGIARLEHGTCMGCRMKLSAVELDRIRHEAAEAIIRCEECGAILVVR